MTEVVQSIIFTAKQIVYKYSVQLFFKCNKAKDNVETKWIIALFAIYVMGYLLCRGSGVNSKFCRYKKTGN